MKDAAGEADGPAELRSDRCRMLDTRWLGRGGPGRVTEMLLGGLVQDPPPGRWVLWGRPPPQLVWASATVIRARHDPHAWYGQRAAWSIPPASTNIWPHQYRPLRRTAATELTVIYDTITLHLAGGPVRELQRAYLRRVAANSTRIITVSKYSASTIVNDLGVDEGRLVVVPPVLDPEVTARVRAGRAQLRAADELGPPYALFIGRFAPHKNLRRLLAAFASTAFSSSGRLRLVGGTAQEVREVEELASRHSIRVDVMGACSQDRLEALLAGATVLVQPSVEEGYGLPVAEALAAGIPVASSSAGALLEAAAGRAETFDPFDVQAMAAAIDQAAAAADPAPIEERSPADFARQVLTVVLDAERAVG